MQDYSACGSDLGYYWRPWQVEFSPIILNSITLCAILQTSRSVATAPSTTTTFTSHPSDDIHEAILLSVSCDNTTTFTSHPLDDIHEAHNLGQLR